MACFPYCNKALITLLILLLPLTISSSSDNSTSLNPHYYGQSCPNFLDIVRKDLYTAMYKDKFIGAAILRIHFHDCFVNGCDGSILLDNSPNISSEKNAKPNMNCLSGDGFNLVDAVKASVETLCPATVSCADILATIAMLAVDFHGGEGWEVPLGRKDSGNASVRQANTDMPFFSNNLQELLSKFKNKGLNDKDLVVLSGAHTIGFSKCKNFRGRLYNEASMDPGLAQNLKNSCSKTGGQGDNNLAALDPYTPELFDNKYFVALTNQMGLLHTDQLLYQDNGNTCIRSLVKMYSEEPNTFLSDFADSMIKMSSISPLIGTDGQIRKNCRRPN